MSVLACKVYLPDVCTLVKCTYPMSVLDLSLVKCTYLMSVLGLSLDRWWDGEVAVGAWASCPLCHNQWVMRWWKRCWDSNGFDISTEYLPYRAWSKLRDRVYHKCVTVWIQRLYYRQLTGKGLSIVIVLPSILYRDVICDTLSWSLVCKYLRAVGYMLALTT